MHLQLAARGETPPPRPRRRDPQSTNWARKRFQPGLLALLALAGTAAASEPTAQVLRGTVRDAHAHEGVQGIEVNVHIWRSDDPADRGAEAVLQQVQLVTDAKGHFESAADLATGPATLSLYDPATERVLQRRDGKHAPGVQSPPNGWQFEVNIGPTVPLQITSPEPRPNGWRARIVSRTADGTDHVWSWRAVRVGEPPWVRWPFVEEARGELRIEVQGSGRSRVGSARLPRAIGTLPTVRIDASPRSILRGRVGAASECWLTSVSVDGSVRHARSNANGEYELSGLAPGPCTLVLHRNFGRPHVARLELEGDHTHEHDFEVASEPRGSLRVELPETLALPAVLALDSAQESETGPALAALCAALPLGDPGAVTFADLPLESAHYRLSVWSADGRAWPTVDIEGPGSIQLEAPPAADPGRSSPVAKLLQKSEAADTVRLHLREVPDQWDPRDLAAYALSIERSEPVAGALVHAGESTFTSDPQGLVELPREKAARLEIEATGRSVFPSPGFADGRVQLSSSDIVVWLHPLPR